MARIKEAEFWRRQLGAGSRWPCSALLFCVVLCHSSSAVSALNPASAQQTGDNFALQQALLLARPTLSPTSPAKRSRPNAKLTPGAFSIPTGSAVVILQGHDEGLDPRLVNVLTAPEEPIQETINLTSLLKVSLNPLDRRSAMPDRAEFTCIRSRAGAKGFALLPRCPNLTACDATLTFMKRTSGVRPSAAPRLGARLVPEGALAACSSGFQDEDRLSFPKPPANCGRWYNWNPRRKAHALKKYLRSGQMDGDWAESKFLMQNPSAGCAHNQDFHPSSPVAYPVYAMKNTYIGGDSIMFNRTTLFVRLGCQDDVNHYKPSMGFIRGEKSIKRVGEVMNWSYRSSINFFHTLIESFPIFLLMAPFLRENPNLPLLGLHYQFDVYHRLLEPLVGVPLQNIRRYEMQQEDIVLADTVYQPVYQMCGKQSKGLWSELRRRHLLHPQGLPMFNADWTPRATRALNERQMRQVPRDWVVVLAVRPNGTERSIPRTDEIESGLVKLFGPKRVVRFFGMRTILETQALFRRARIFVAAHGAAMSNMIFMPSGSAVLEIRPDGYPNPCFHSLARACSLEYNLVIGAGTKDEVLRVDPKNVMGVINGIIKRFALATR